MTESRNASSNPLLVFLVIVLLLAVGGQGYYLHRMNRQLERVVAQAAAPTDGPAAARVHGAFGRAVALGPADASPAPTPVPSPPAPSAPSGAPRQALTPPLLRSAPAWDPFAEMQSMQQEMDRLFNQSFNRFFGSPQASLFDRTWSFSPNLDIEELEGQYVIRVDMPGIDLSSVKVSLKDQVLEISAATSNEAQQQDAQGQMIVQERQSGMFQRSIILPKPIDSAGMKTNYDHGVLTITVPIDQE